MSLIPSLDWTVFKAPDIRRSLLLRATFLDAGLKPDHPLCIALLAPRDAYARRIGLRRYINEMLGELATEPAIEFRYYKAGGVRWWPAVGRGPGPSEGVTAYLARICGRNPERLPFRVELGAEVKYL